jgi:hypothetical protein
LVLPCRTEIVGESFHDGPGLGGALWALRACSRKTPRAQQGSALQRPRVGWVFSRPTQVPAPSEAPHRGGRAMRVRGSGRQHRSRPWRQFGSLGPSRGSKPNLAPPFVVFSRGSRVVYATIHDAWRGRGCVFDPPLLHSIPRECGCFVSSVTPRAETATVGGRAFTATGRSESRCRRCGPRWGSRGPETARSR